MYGHHVHEAVLSSKELDHGITIHYVNEKFDEGEHLFQKKFQVDPTDTLETISSKLPPLKWSIPR